MLKRWLERRRRVRAIRKAQAIILTLERQVVLETHGGFDVLYRAWHYLDTQALCV